MAELSRLRVIALGFRLDSASLVRMSLEQFLLAKGISAEKTLEIEYIKSVAPRKQEEPSLHNDWVSAVDGSCPRFILTGCYDGFWKVWRGAGQCTHMLEGHSDAITSVGIINHGDTDTVTVATASKDQTLRLWKFDTAKSIKIILQRFREPFKILLVDTNGICTERSDTEGNLVSIKKRKVKNEAEESQLERESFSTLVGHTQCVSAVVWPERETIYSASWDHSIRRWDVETGKDSSKIFCGKALNCVHIGGEGSALIAAGGSDAILRIWDPRKPGSSAPIYQFSSHTSWISACKWHDKSWFHLLTSSYDGKACCGIVDCKGTWPLAVIESHEDKVLCADWWKSDSLISGGVDCKLCISSDISIL
ncbi:ribosome biogenesis protein WDR12 homolog [Jatropha curcas]|uniref:ribosome biogenesis protein WDR12 homolog n=1 Tax=Jatropha curcas TaxID=180498 RepID=UPI001894C8C6|nr:ribosome biogenesis protein WDR12 homolog [Jatropha curcas]